MTADWARHAVFWQVYPLGFVGAEPTATLATPIRHRLPRLVDWLDYAVELGASALLLGPIFASSTHGYDTIDPFRIDPRLGDDRDFDALIAAVHQRGLRVVLDGVFHHVGREHPAFQAVLRDGPAAPEAAWFRLSWPRGTNNEPDYATFEGHRILVALDHGKPQIAELVTRIMLHWLDRGADGWRLDAAYAVPRPFWADVVARVRQRHPDAYLFGEVLHGDHAGFVRDTGVDATTQYELWKALWSAMNDRNLFELAWALDRHDALLADFAPQTFAGNHDVTRIASQLTDERHLPHVLAVLFTVGGTPAIYAGDEQAFRGVKESRAGGDDAIRPVFPARPADLAPYGWPTYRLLQQLIGLRRRHPWLHRARIAKRHVANRQLAFTVHDGDHALLVALNLDDAPAAFPCPLGAQRAGPALAAANTLAPHSWAIFEP